MGTSDKKWRKKKMSKHKHRKRLKKTRWQRRTK
ncbi:MAG TPA: AURKAIP1/COX24 domain-containing protein [Anaerolineae bacterium]|nr:AURKAIP1/COX24 domain-containing protein [Anaerolineae bacterium]